MAGTLIVDGFALAHSIFATRKKTLRKYGAHYIYPSLFMGMIDDILSYKNRFNCDTVHILLDNATSKDQKVQNVLESSFGRKSEMYGFYKKNRKKFPEEFYRTVDLVSLYYMSCPPNYLVSRISDLEADDLLKPAVLLAIEEDRIPIVLVTTDSDWYFALRFVDSRGNKVVSLYDPSHGVVLTEKDVQKEYPIPLDEHSLALYKAIVGDSSDNIPSLGLRWPTETINQLINACGGDFSSLLSGYQFYSFLTEEQKREFSAVIRNIKINYFLTSVQPVSMSVFKENTFRGSDNVRFRESLYLAFEAYSIKGPGLFSSLPEADFKD